MIFPRSNLAFSIAFRIFVSGAWRPCSLFFLPIVSCRQTFCIVRIHRWRQPHCVSAHIKTVQFPREWIAGPWGWKSEWERWTTWKPEIRNKSLSFGAVRVSVSAELSFVDVTCLYRLLTLSPRVRPIKQIRWGKGKMCLCVWVCCECRKRKWNSYLNNRTTDTPKLKCHGKQIERRTKRACTYLGNFVAGIGLRQTHLMLSWLHETPLARTSITMWAGRLRFAQNDREKFVSHLLELFNQFFASCALGSTY